MNKDCFVFGLLICAICAVMWGFVSGVNTRLGHEHTSCAKAGGIPRDISGEVICFAPGVIIIPKE